MLPSSSLIHTWGEGPSANVGLIDWGKNDRAIVKKYRRGQIKAMWCEYLALIALRATGFVPRVLRFSPVSRTIVIEWIEGVTLIEWVLHAFGCSPEEIAKYRWSRIPIRTDTIVLEAFGRFRHSRLPECLSLRRALREAYVMVHSRHIVHNDIRPVNIICRSVREEGCSVCLIDFGRATLRWDAARRDESALAFWYGI